MPVFSQSDQATKQVLRQASQQLLRFSHFRHEPSAAHNFGRGRGAENAPSCVRFSKPVPRASRRTAVVCIQTVVYYACERRTVSRGRAG
jgi:hypothetical protein